MKSVVVLLVDVSLLRSFEGMGGLNVTDVRRERIPLLWSRVRERTLANYDLLQVLNREHLTALGYLQGS